MALRRLLGYSHGTFLGGELCCSQAELNLWEKILTKYDFKRILNFGTWKGEHALFLLLFCIKKKAEFLTYDNLSGGNYIDCPVKQVLDFKKHTVIVDIFAEIGKEKQPIRDKIKEPGRTILFCDDGNKTSEFRLFSPHLKINDIVAIHDWKQQVDPEVVDTSNFREIGSVDKVIFFLKIK